MAIQVPIPGAADLYLQYLLLDVNGTLTNRGQLTSGVQPRIERLRPQLEVHLLSAHTFGTLEEIAQQLGAVHVERISRGADKAAIATRLGASECVAVGNGHNDAPMLSRVALGITVLGPEGTSPRALEAADICAPSIGDALDLLLDAKALSATLRS